MAATKRRYKYARPLHEYTTSYRSDRMSEHSRFDVSEDTVKEIADALAHHFDPHGVWLVPYNKMEVYEPGFHADSWTIACEEADPTSYDKYDNWPAEATEYLREHPKFKLYYVEAVNHWCLAVVGMK